MSPIFRLAEISSIRPFDGLPDESLAEIFEHCTYVQRVKMHTFPSIAQKQLRTLLAISSVSSRWRNVAIGASQLWTWIAIVAQVFRKGEVGRHIIEAFLERSKDRSIWVDLFLPIGNVFPPDAFLEAYEPITHHLHRCSAFCCYQLSNSTISLLFPLAGPMQRLVTLFLMGDVTLPSVTLFADPSSLTELRNLTIIGVPVAPIPDNSIEQLRISVHYPLPAWALPLVASSTKATSLALRDDDVLGDVPSTRVILPNLKILYHNQSNLSPYLDAPELEELHWTSCQLHGQQAHTPSQVPSFSSVTKLFLYSPVPHRLDHSPSNKIECPNLTDLTIDSAMKVSTILRGLLLPHTFGQRIDHHEKANEPVVLPYPDLRVVRLQTTDGDTTGAMREVLVALLESYRNIRLEYDAQETFPQGDEEFWDELRQAYGGRVLATSEVGSD
ncbi:hypothetical protein DL93DRAFT_2228756 [Clavulina sp. PMI_390]|nr:hypothetical protein DL93DRAFT_2228756 [Clavulina sp. PMI_390]